MQVSIIVNKNKTLRSVECPLWFYGISLEKITVEFDTLDWLLWIGVVRRDVSTTAVCLGPVNPNGIVKYLRSSAYDAIFKTSSFL